MFENPVFSSSPWGFRFFEIPDYCRTLKNIGIEKIKQLANIFMTEDEQTELFKDGDG